MSVRVTFYEHIIPAKTKQTNYTTNQSGWYVSEFSTPELPSTISVLDVLGAAYDSENKVWRVLTRRYEDVP